MAFFEPEVVHQVEAIAPSAPDAVPEPASEPVPSPTPAVVPKASSSKAVTKASGLRKARRSLSPESGAIKPQPQEDVPPPGPLVDPTWSEPIDAEGVVKAWSDFVQKLRDGDQLALVATMSAHQPTLSGHKVSFVVNNPLQREQMDGLRTEVLVHLKTTLQNAQLELSLAMREQPMEEKKAFLSDKDRYELMAEKNPSLEKLRKALDLDLA